MSKTRTIKLSKSACNKFAEIVKNREGKTDKEVAKHAHELIQSESIKQTLLHNVKN